MCSSVSVRFCFLVAWLGSRKSVAMEEEKEPVIASPAKNLNEKYK